MGTSPVGTVVLVSYPFSNLEHVKLRPALVIAASDFDNVIVAQITSKLPVGSSGITLENEDFQDENPLKTTSYVRVNKLFTADPSLIKKPIGLLTSKKQRDIYNQLMKVFSDLS